MKNKILYTVLLIFTIFAFFSCENEPIFYNIAKEVPLLDSVVTGNVYSMVEQGGYLFAANGKIFRKAKYDEVTPQSNPWKLFDKPEGVIIKLASTDNYLYALSVADTSSENPTYTIYSSPAVSGDTKPTWTKVEVTGVKTIFDNEAKSSTGKLRAFYSTKDGIYELTNGTAATTNIKTEGNFVSTKKEVDDEEVGFAVKAAYVELNDTTLFSDDLSFCSDRVSTFYKVDEKLARYSTDAGSNWATVNPDISDSASACYYEYEGNAWIYVGTATKDGPGLQVVNLKNNNIPTTTVSEPVGENIASCLDDTQVIGLYPFPYESGNLYAASVVLLSTTAFSNDNQLWGYYPTGKDGRENNSWNRE
ncbi:MAG: hypothetical protein IIX47_03005 [Spirochaetaceae bacterium]|nr:hypothetical protein [Spirochaetaceae bacterium]